MRLCKSEEVHAKVLLIIFSLIIWVIWFGLCMFRDPCCYELQDWSKQIQTKSPQDNVATCRWLARLEGLKTLRCLRKLANLDYFHILYAYGTALEDGLETAVRSTCGNFDHWAEEAVSLVSRPSPRPDFKPYFYWFSVKLHLPSDSHITVDSYSVCNHLPFWNHFHKYYYYATS